MNLADMALLASATRLTEILAAIGLGSLVVLMLFGLVSGDEEPPSEVLHLDAGVAHEPAIDFKRAA